MHTVLHTIVTSQTSTPPQLQLKMGLILLLVCTSTTTFHQPTTEPSTTRRSIKSKLTFDCLLYKLLNLYTIRITTCIRYSCYTRHNFAVFVNQYLNFAILLNTTRKFQLIWSALQFYPSSYWNYLSFYILYTVLLWFKTKSYVTKSFCNITIRFINIWLIY